MSLRCKLSVATAVFASVWALSASAAPDKKSEDTQKKFERFCVNTKAASGERFAERLSGRLNLRDGQKPALTELRDAFAKSMADAKASLCSTKPDFATTPGRFAFAKRRAEIRFERMKTIEAKLTAFYNVLDDKQKASLDEMQLWAPNKQTTRGATDKKSDNDGNNSDDQ